MTFAVQPPSTTDPSSKWLSTYSEGEPSHKMPLCTRADETRFPARRNARVLLLPREFPVVARGLLFYSILCQDADGQLDYLANVSLPTTSVVKSSTRGYSES